MATFIATTKAGNEIKRNSKTKEYTHCLLSGTKDTSKWGPTTEDGAIAFAVRLDLAQRQLEKWQHMYPEAYIVEVTKK